MSLLSKIGKPRLSGKAAVAAAVVGGYGFTSGVKSTMQGASGEFIDSLLGTENADQYVLGTDFGFRSAFLPLPMERRMQRWGGLRQGMHHSRAASARDQYGSVYFNPSDYTNKMPRVSGGTVFDRYNHRGR